MKNSDNVLNDYKYIPLDDSRNYFYTNDFDLAVCLLCKSFVLVSIDKAPEGKLLFIFNNSKDLKKTSDGYWANTIVVHPLEFANTRKNLKSRTIGIQRYY